MRKIIYGDNVEVLKTLPDQFASLIYIDPPFNTGVRQHRTRIDSHANGESAIGRIGFGGKRYATKKRTESGISFNDKFDDFETYLMDRVKESLHCLKSNGSIFIHLDYREVHYIKVAMDKLLGRDKFMNEIIWSYDYGARSKAKWSSKHDTILWYVLDPKDYIFNHDAIDRIPYMAPSLVTKEKAELGKTPTDVWWSTIVPTCGKEKVNYPTQKPLKIIDRIIKVHTNPEDVVLDFFAGSSTSGFSAASHGRNFVMIDKSLDAVNISAKRLSNWSPELVNFNLREAV